MSRIEIELDDSDTKGLQALAVLKQQPTQKVAAGLLQWSIRYEAERLEDEQRWQAIEQGDYIENDDMMRWLDNLAEGKDV